MIYGSLATRMHSKLKYRRYAYYYFDWLLSYMDKNIRDISWKIITGGLVNMEAVVGWYSCLPKVTSCKKCKETSDEYIVLSDLLLYL